MVYGLRTTNAIGALIFPFLLIKLDEKRNDLTRDKRRTHILFALIISQTKITKYGGVSAIVELNMTQSHWACSASANFFITLPSTDFRQWGERRDKRWQRWHVPPYFFIAIESKSTVVLKKTASNSLEQVNYQFVWHLKAIWHCFALCVCVSWFLCELLT